MGKTTAQLWLSVAYMKEHPDQLTKLVYCCHTVPEQEKVVEKLRIKLMDYYEKDCEPEQIKGLLERVVVCSYKDLLDPEMTKVELKEIPKNSVVIFDEAHNIYG